MHGVWDSQKTLLYPLFSSNKVTCRKNKNYEPNALNATINNIAIEVIREKFYYLTHPAQDTTYSNS